MNPRSRSAILRAALKKRNVNEVIWVLGLLQKYH
jgi:hypothetical protein